MNHKRKESSLVVHVQRLNLFTEPLRQSELNTINARWNVSILDVDPEFREDIKKAILITLQNTKTNSSDVDAIPKTPSEFCVEEPLVNRIRDYSS